LIADTSNPASLDPIVSQTKVVLTTVGPYLKHGESLVEACVKWGADYVDITGEPPFIKKMADRFHKEAESKGVKIVHGCGFDSIPSDLGVLL
jgi:short subunit dehydrogenase-like uncharacterized protein